MDTNRVEGFAREMGGKVQDAAGGLTGDAKTQAQGKVNQVAGKLQSEYGSAADAVVNAAGQVSDAVKAQPLAALVVAGAIGYLIASLRR